MWSIAQRKGFSIKWFVGVCFPHKCPNLPFLPCDQGASAVQENVLFKKTQQPSVTALSAEMHSDCSDVPCRSRSLSLLSAC